MRPSFPTCCCTVAALRARSAIVSAWFSGPVLAVITLSGKRMKGTRFGYLWSGVRARCRRGGIAKVHFCLCGIGAVQIAIGIGEERRLRQIDFRDLVLHVDGERLFRTAALRGL